MDMSWPAELDDFRAELREWLAAHLRNKTFPELRLRDTIAPLREWEVELFEAGWSAIEWPVAYGGRGASALHAAVFAEEYVRSGAPGRLNRQALLMAAPTIMAVGSDEQKQRWLRNILTCDQIWCQGFSEPDSGSDLASLRTRADRHGDTYLVNGQKIWASNGPCADWIFALVRTNPEAPKHRGISYLMIDLSTPGVEVRPIDQVDGHGEFAEVFFTDVEVPVENRLGAQDDGWNVAMTTLTFERSGRSANVAQMHGIIADIGEIMRATGAADDDAYCVELAELRAHVRRYELNTYSSLSSHRKVEQARLETMHKLDWSVLQNRLYEFGMRILGTRAELGAPGVPESVTMWHHRYWLARAALIYAGTNEIQRNIVAERVLGLPKEPVAS
jgi:alkylation response protein AidB-like acyl-CoA dehydrogenase